MVVRSSRTPAANRAVCVCVLCWCVCCVGVSVCACASSVVGAVWQRVRPAQNRAARECGRTGSPRSAHSSWPYPRTCAVSARAQRHHASRHSMPVRPFRLRWRQQKGSAASCAAPRAPSSLRTRHPGVESPDALRGDSVDACVSNRPPMHDLVHRCASAGRESLPARDSGEDNRDGCSAGCHAERCAGAKAAAATVSSARVAARDFIGHCTGAHRMRSHRQTARTPREELLQCTVRSTK